MKGISGQSVNMCLLYGYGISKILSNCILTLSYESERHKKVIKKKFWNVHMQICIPIPSYIRTLYVANY